MTCERDFFNSLLVCGAGGFIGGHLVKRLKKEGFWVRGVDIKEHEYIKVPADEFIVGDLRDPVVCQKYWTNLLMRYIN